MDINSLEALAKNDPKYLLLPGEVAAIFRVDPKTVTRWATAGKIASIRTLGGHRRFHAAEVYRALMGEKNANPEQRRDTTQGVQRSPTGRIVPDPYA